MSAETRIVIRDCESLDEYEQCVALQQAIWGWTDRELIPARMLVVAHKIEGHVLGAFNAAGRMVGFSLAIPALHGARAYLHSHMLGVLPEYRESGLGRRLKLEQRRKALDAGIKLIEWTFDPLELKNAYFNIEKLGAIARRYVINQYGISTSHLHRGLPTDRLIAEWWLDSSRVVARVNGDNLPPSDIGGRIAVPFSVATAASAGATDRAEVQLKVRGQFQAAFSEGLVVVGFEASKETGTYLLGSLQEK